MADITLVRFFFYPDAKPKKRLAVARLLSLVYQAITEQDIVPVAILIR
jgi:hypothetical protein